MVVVLATAAPVRAADDAHSLERIRRALQKPAPVLTRASIASAGKVDTRAMPRAPQAARSSDPVWEGLLIGAAIGGVGGYIWARQICGGTDDTECFLISAPVGIAGGVGIGALVGAIADRFHK